VSEVFGWRRVPPFLAVALGLLALGACLADVVSSTALHQSGPGGPAAEWLITSAVALPGTAVGVLLAARRPANPIGWLLLTRPPTAESVPLEIPVPVQAVPAADDQPVPAPAG